MTMLKSLFKQVVPLMILLQFHHHVDAFHTASPGQHHHKQQQRQCQTELSMSSSNHMSNESILSRRSLFRSAGLASAFGLTFAATTSLLPSIALAAERPPLDALLYRIVRVREATQQEMRLIKNGTFKDVQRANIKLAVKFMIENYRLADAFVAASAYLDGNDRRVAAGQVGQAAVQNLYTIMEYFDSSDVQNLKVGSRDSYMAGKEELVLKGLDATQKTIDDFLAYFPKSDIEKVTAMVQEENALNVKEFDSAKIGALLNMPKP